MSLTDDQLVELLRGHGIPEILEIKRTKHEARNRAVLNKIEIYTKDNKILSLLEKITMSKYTPYENIIYNHYSSKEVSIPKVFINKYDTVSQEGILLMEDLTPTHNNLADWEVPIASEKLANIIEVIAQFHAASWETSELALPEHLKSVEDYLIHITYLERDYLDFRKQQTYNFGEEQFRIYEKSLFSLRENAQQHIKRISRYQNTTCIHGDLNVGNLLYPVFNSAKPCIIDLEAVKVGLCTEDLVMLFIHDLFYGSEETSRIFDLYFHSINNKIRSEYTYTQFVEDVRLSIMEGIFFPLKLFVHDGIKDEELIWKSIAAYKNFGD
ncbi:phosphotransferase [Paenibacillus sp. FSL K6-0276]|uniref:phosphotransferase n=1 Tax=unclassified Paenibacillus TaxID=185978 RepID=UPI0028A72678|nr:phosphotransferase [Paenibacillus sp.]